MFNASVSSARGGWVRKLVFGLVALMVVVGAGFALYTWITLSYSYSEGDRVGFVQKFSRKGWVCKTWEGELQMIVALPGATPQIFPFSVRDAAVSEQINALMGKQVKLHYEQHVGVPSRCFGETEYFITKVEAAR